jgi:hypothetical protein
MIEKLRRSPDLREKYIEMIARPNAPQTRSTAEVNRLLHKTFITPIDREQIQQPDQRDGRRARPAARTPPT